MKTKLILLTTVTLLAGCSSKPAYEHNLSIISPIGAPALAFYNYAEDENFETNREASNIVPIMKQGLKDVVVLPTNVGVNAIEKQNVDYKIAATITFGNLFIASTGHDEDEVMDKDDYIVLFTKGSVPDLLFHSIYGNELDEGIRYVRNNEDAVTCLKTGHDDINNGTPDYVLVAEPGFTSAKAAKENVNEYIDLQKLYKEKYEAEIFQASVFIKNGVDASLFLSSLEEDINKAIENPDIIGEKLSEIENPQGVFGVPPEMASKVTKNGNRMGLGFKLAKENKEGIDKFLSVFSISETSEEIYY